MTITSKFNLRSNNLMDRQVVDEILDPLARCFTAAAAHNLRAFKASPKVEALIEELADKISHGTPMTSEEKQIYGALVYAVDFVSLLQIKVGRLLSDTTAND